MNFDSKPSSRILSLDVFRGLTIVLMIVVNSQGNQNPYFILSHAEWNGCTLADLVFPFFLFIVGLTSVISFNKYSKDQIQYREIIKRSFNLFMLGLFLNIFPFNINLHSLRVYGILQRIALCYLVCSVIYLNTSIKIQITLFISILLGYWFFMTLVPVPGFGVNQLTPEGSWVSYMDQLLFSDRHLFAKLYDPEGFLSTVPSIATTFSGMFVGRLLLTSMSGEKKTGLMIGIGLIFAVIGWLWSFSFPFNKNLWTSSFVLWTSGWAIFIFSACYFIIDMKHYEKWGWPLKVFGMNAIFAFTVHVLLLKLQFAFYFTLTNGAKISTKLMITNYLFSGFPESMAALMYSLVFLMLNFCFVLFLYQRKLFLKI